MRIINYKGIYLEDSDTSTTLKLVPEVSENDGCFSWLTFLLYLRAHPWDEAVEMYANTLEGGELESFLNTIYPRGD